MHRCRVCQPRYIHSHRIGDEPNYLLLRRFGHWNIFAGGDICFLPMPSTLVPEANVQQSIISGYLFVFRAHIPAWREQRAVTPRLCSSTRHEVQFGQRYLLLRTQLRTECFHHPCRATPHFRLRSRLEAQKSSRKSLSVAEL